MSMSDKIREILGNLFMAEDAARLDYIKDKNVRRTEEIICYAECEKSVQICVRSHELVVKAGIESLWTLTSTVSIIFCLLFSAIDLYHCK